MNRRNLQYKRLMPIPLVAVCSPEFARNNKLTHEPSDTPNHDLIHADVGDHELGEEWCQWLTGCGVKRPDKLPGLSFQDPALAIRAFQN